MTTPGWGTMNKMWVNGRRVGAWTYDPEAHSVRVLLKRVPSTPRHHGPASLNGVVLPSAEPQPGSG